MKPLTPCVVLTVLFASCAGVAPTDLRLSTHDMSVSLRSPILYNEYYSIAGNRFHYIIDAGKYAAKYEDAGGMYFEGPGKCFTIRIESDSLKKEGKPQPTPHNYRCGLYVPKQTTVEPKLYFYHDVEVSEAVFSNTKAQVVDRQGAPSTAPGAATGAGLGMALVRAFDAAELKNLHFYQDQPKPGQIRSAIE